MKRKVTHIFGEKSLFLYSKVHIPRVVSFEKYSYIISSILFRFQSHKMHWNFNIVLYSTTASLNCVETFSATD